MKDHTTVKQEPATGLWSIYLNDALWEDGFLRKSAAEEVAYHLLKRYSNPTFIR